jgi:hypothetical protein
MKRFLVTYLAPASVIADWKKTDPAQRRDAEVSQETLAENWAQGLLAVAASSSR